MYIDIAVRYCRAERCGRFMKSSRESFDCWVKVEWPLILAAAAAAAVAAVVVSHQILHITRAISFLSFPYIFTMPFRRLFSNNKFLRRIINISHVISFRQGSNANEVRKDEKYTHSSGWQKGKRMQDICSRCQEMIWRFHFEMIKFSVVIEIELLHFMETLVYAYAIEPELRLERIRMRK